MYFCVFSGDKQESVFVFISLWNVFSYKDVQFKLFAFHLVTTGVSSDLP